MKNTVLQFPVSYTEVTSAEQYELSGGRRYYVYRDNTGYRVLNFFAYLLSNFNFSFGSSTSHTNSDTITSSSSSYGSSTSHQSNVDNVSSGQHMSWSANFNLGKLFAAVLYLFV